MKKPALIPLTKGRGLDAPLVGYALVDEEDREWAERFTWHLNHLGYAVRQEPRPSKTRLLMHREILSLPPGDQRLGDHINRNRLDNRRANLRPVSRLEHNQNMGGHADSRYSTLRGVSFRPDRGKWRAYAQIAGQWFHLGYFDTELEAHEIVSAWRAEHMPNSVEGALV